MKKQVRQDLADAINNMHAILKRDFGCDFSFQICGNGKTIAQSNINGEILPVAIVPSVVDKNLAITRLNITTKQGNTLGVFYNPQNNLLVVDVVHQNEKGGNEIVRQTLNEGKLLSHCK